MDWSWGLLSEAEQIFLRQLSIFAGGWTLESAQAVCDGDILSLTGALVNKSLIVVNREEGQETRYHFHEIVRQYARDKLVESGGSDLVRDRHLAYFVKLSERAEPELYRADQVRWLNRLRDELDNLRLAMEWALATDSESGIRLLVSSRLFWDVLGDFRELENWLAQLLEQYHGVDALRARGLVIYSQLLRYREDFAKARVIAEQSLDLSRAISDQPAEAFSLWGLGILQDDSGQAKSLLEESLALYRSLGDKFGQAVVLNEIGSGLAQHNPFDNNLLLESLRLYREIGHLSAIAICLCDLAHSASRGGDFSSPVQWLEEARTLYRQLGYHLGEAYVSFVYGHLAYWQGDFNQACAYAQKTITLNENHGMFVWSSWAHTDLAYAVLRQGDILRAKKIFGFCIQQFQKANTMGGLTYAIEGLASLNVEQKQPERAARLFGWVDATREQINYPRPPVELASVERDLAMIHSQISDDAFEEAYESGKVMTLEEAVTFALSNTNGYSG
jgi:tetratricopeptide (TPR) repeat protein